MTGGRNLRPSAASGTQPIRSTDGRAARPADVRASERAIAVEVPSSVLGMDGRRPSGSAPYWLPGTQVMWREGDGPLGTGAAVVDPRVPHFAQPVTVVHDDADSFVAWLPCTTPVLRAARADGRGKRDDPGTMFTADLVQERGTHAFFDQLRIAPTGRPWSVWVFFAEGSGAFTGW